MSHEDFPIYCIAWGFGSLPKYLKDFLFLNAMDMAQNKRRTQRVKGKNFNGAIKTKFEAMTIGGHSLVVFNGEIEHAGKVYEVQFGVRSADVDPEILMAEAEANGGGWCEAMILGLQKKDFQEKSDDDEKKWQWN